MSTVKPAQPKKKNRTALWITLALVIMAAIVGVLAYINAPRDVPAADQSGEMLRVVQGESTLKAYTMAQLQALPALSAEKEIVSGSHANDAGVFTGVALHALLKDAAGEDALADVKKIYVYAQDGYMTSYKMSEIANNDNFLLVYSKDGNSLGSMADGGTGPVRLLVVSDEFGTRSTKYTYKIEIK